MACPQQYWITKMGYENDSALSYVTVLFPVGDNEQLPNYSDALGLSTVSTWFKMNVCLKFRCVLIILCVTNKPSSSVRGGFCARR